MARFWAKFIEEKVLATRKKISFVQGKERELVIEEFCQQMKLLENELDGKDFFGGDTIGFVDVVANIVAFWFPLTEELIVTGIFTRENCPVLFNWMGKITEIDAVNECRPPREKHRAYLQARLKGLKSAPT